MSKTSDWFTLPESWDPTRTYVITAGRKLGQVMFTEVDEAGEPIMGTEVPVTFPEPRRRPSRGFARHARRAKAKRSGETR